MVELCSAGKRLEKWLTKEGRTKAWLARELKVAPAVLWRWMAGKQVPRVDFATRIQSITASGVPTGAWQIPARKAA